MDKEYSIGESSTTLLTRADLLKLIENNFEDDGYSNIAVLTTIKAGDYHNPTVSQSLTLSKII